MFGVGKHYEFRMIENGDEVVFSGQVEAYEHPLLKIMDLPEREIDIRFRPRVAPGQEAPAFPGMLPRRPGQIINLTSPHFISALEKVG